MKISSLCTNEALRALWWESYGTPGVEYNPRCWMPYPVPCLSVGCKCMPGQMPIYVPRPDMLRVLGLSLDYFSRGGGIICHKSGSREGGCDLRVGVEVRPQLPGMLFPLNPRHSFCSRSCPPW